MTTETPQTISLRAWQSAFTKHQRLVIALAYITREHRETVDKAIHASEPAARERITGHIVASLEELVTGQATPSWPAATCDHYGRLTIAQVIPPGLFIRWLTFKPELRAELRFKAASLAEKHFPAYAPLVRGGTL